MSDDPVRLLDDPTAPAALRGDLGCASKASGLSFDAGAGLARLTAAIGALPPPGGGGSGGAPSPAAGGAGAGAGGGAGAGAAGAGSVFGSGTFWGFIAAGVVCGGVILAVPPSAPEPPRAAVASAPLRPAPAATTTPAARPASAQAPAESPTPGGTAEPVPPSARPPGRAPQAALGAGGGKGTTTAGEAEPPAARGSSDLAAEVEDSAALRTMARSDPARAVEVAAAGQRRFANGVFGEEREAIAIGALARSGRSDEAKRRARAFLAERPNSVFAEDVRRVLAP